MHTQSHTASSQKVQMILCCNLAVLRHSERGSLKAHTWTGTSCKSSESMMRANSGRIGVEFVNFLDYDGMKDYMK